jgi:hypothetical protein
VFSRYENPRSESAKSKRDGGMSVITPSLDSLL